MKKSKHPRVEGFPLVAPNGRFDLKKWLSHHAPYDRDCDYCVEAEDFANSDQWDKVEHLLVAALEAA